MTLAEILTGADSIHSLVVFEPSAIRAIESSLTEKGGKWFVRCQIRAKDIQAKPEEIVRQLWIYRLVHHYQYLLTRLAVEYPITFGRDSSKRADIVIFDADRPTVPYVIFEVKEPTAKDGKDQLKSYAHATGAPLAMWSNGNQPVVWHRKNPNYFVEIPDLPTASQTIDAIVGQPWTIETLIEKEKQREAEGLRARSLRELIEDMEDEVLANAGVDVFEEVFKLIFTKLYDELACYRGRYSFLRFRNANTAAQLKTNIQSLFDEAKAEWEGVFPSDEKIRLTADHLQVCIGSLEEWKLFNSNLDVIDDAFEYLVTKSAKGEKGQYFTPRWVIDMCVKMLNPKEDETLIDTACGSAGFTVHSIFHVWHKILLEMGLPASHLFTMEEKPARCKNYVREKVFAIDFDDKSVRVARCLNLIAGDGQTNVLHLNTLDWKKWDETTKQQEWVDTYNEGWKKLRKLMTDRRQLDYRSFQFDVLMANPPFAGDVKQSDMLSLYELSHKRSGKLEGSVGRDLLFIERNLDFLKPGGRMAIVLPQGRLNNSGDRRVREYVAERCRILAVVGLHLSTFKPHTGTKTSVMLVQKWTAKQLDERTAIRNKIKEDFERHFKKMEESLARESRGAVLPPLAEDVVVAAMSVEPSEEQLEREVKAFGAPLAGLAEHELEQEAAELRAKLPRLKGKPYYAVEGNLEKIYLELARRDARNRIKYLCEYLKKEYEIAYIHSREAGSGLDYNIFFATQRLSSKEPNGEKIIARDRNGNLLRDSHGHWVVQHDLFNHENLTRDGIAEAFIEFAAKEKLSFF